VGRFRKILIANRGEIALRIVRACRALGIRSAAIYSEADCDAPHVRLADEAWPCGPARATESYLDRDRVVSLARHCGAEAIHPGYGFLSENAAFAEAAAAAGLVFIGPSPEVLRTMGLKIPSRERMRRAGVPVVPGSPEIRDLGAARRRAEELGYPVLVKASAGGGGRGMRRVESESALERASEAARSEAGSAFGDDAIYLEKVLREPRHIEIQILADGRGGIVHLGERDCSIQRRHQKLVEEAPAFGVDPGLRARMGEAAVRAARAVDYQGAGTCEFLLDAAGEFYFLEMNTRIQVEHPVTESVTGIDLVELQIRIAAGEALPFEQPQIAWEGHAIEMRLYAEDPEKGFLPSPGRIAAWSPPSGPGIRLDGGVVQGQTVSSHYDPLLAKLIASGRDREQALARLEGALEELAVAGIRTGLPFLRRVVAHPVFRAGGYDTGFIERHLADPPPPLSASTRARVLAAVALAVAGTDVGTDAGSPADADSGRQSGAGSGGSDSGSDSGERVGGGGALRCLAVSIAREAPERVEWRAGELPLEVRVGDHALRLDGLWRDGVLVTGVFEGEVLRLSLVEKKSRVYDVGLRDRVLRVRCDGGPSA